VRRQAFERSLNSGSFFIRKNTALPERKAKKLAFKLYFNAPARRIRQALAPMQAKSLNVNLRYISQ